MPVPGLETRQSGARSLQIAELAHETDRVLRLKLRSSDGQPLPSWTPGAHIDIECGSSDGKARQYSLCGDPQAADTYEVAILREDAGRGGSAWLHAHARAGASLKIRGPRNHFRLDTTASRLVLIAGGIGITPIMAMADEARRRGIDYELHYAGKTREAMPMLQALQALHGARLVLHTSSEGRRLDLAEMLREATPGTKVYACGPARLLEGVEQASSHWPEDAVHMERFSAQGAKTSAEDMQPFEVELRDSCTVLQVPAGQTMLAALREANIDIQSDCEEGLCGSCEARVIEGEVDHRDRVLTAGERACHDRMMTCCSRAKNGRLVLGL
jgi:ferredoxin-NADP reductase